MKRLGTCGLEPSQLALGQILDLQLGGLLSGEDFTLCESWEPFHSGALCLVPAMQTCIVRGRRGQLVLVNYDDLSNPAVESFNIHQAPSAGAAAALAAEARPATTQVVALHEDSVGGDPRQMLLCCASDDGAVHVCRCRCPSSSSCAPAPGGAAIGAGGTGYAEWRRSSSTEGELPSMLAAPMGGRKASASTICAFQAMPRRTNAALCVNWNPWLSQLVTAGRDPNVRIWDLRHEHLVGSFRHNSLHCVTCVAKCGGSLLESGSCCDQLVFVGSGDGSLQMVDPRSNFGAGTVQAHKGGLESVTTISPGVCSEVSNSGSLIASSDGFGVVDLWDLRKQGSLCCYQLGVTTASDLSRHPPFQRIPTLCNTGHSVGGGSLGSASLAASVRMLPAADRRALALTELASGAALCSVLLPVPQSVELRPAALGFHPEQRIGAVLARIGLESRLLLYGATSTAPRQDQGRTRGRV